MNCLVAQNNGPKEKYCSCLAKNKNKSKRLLLIRDKVCGGYNSGLLHSFSNVYGLALEDRSFFSTLSMAKPKMVQAMVVFCHPFHEKIKALHVVLAQFIEVLVRVLEILYCSGPNILQLQL